MEGENAVTVVRLPAALMHTLEVVGLNRRLHDKSATLDWSEVQYVAPGVLTALLAGLDLTENADTIGIETVPDALAPKLEAACPPRHRPAASGNGAREQQTPRPAAWRAPRPVATHADGVSRAVDVAEPAEGATEAARVTEEASPANVGVTSASPSVLTVPSKRALRDELQRAVLHDLLGPAGGPEEEIAENSVRDRYLVGMLAPWGEELDPEQDDELAVAAAGTAEEGQADANTTATRSLSPSSFGLTFTVTGEASRIVVTARWGRYHKERSATLVTPKTGAPRSVWRREQVEVTSPPIPLAAGPIATWRPYDEQPDVYVRGLARRLDDDWIVTLFLVNGQAEPRKNQDRAWLFQAELSVAAPDGVAIFRGRPHLSDGGAADEVIKAEERALAMAYRRRVEFAIGHGVAVHAETAPGAPDRAVRVSTQAVPSYEVARTDAPTPDDVPELVDLTLDMKDLAETPALRLADRLLTLPASYASWIETQRARIDTRTGGLDGRGDVARAAIERCERALTRMREGITLLAHDDKAAEAFRFMNRSMWLQRTHSLYAEERRRKGTRTLAEIDIPDNRRWRPFQLAFILINLPGITDLAHHDRSSGADAVADLLWFPTGGGKTEAYLGLTAYTLGVRRLQGVVAGRDGEHGVAVLMRYTLRLLTLQQTQRAAALICACESIRRDALARGDDRWGKTPFRIGLWVGQRTTPNKTAQADEYIKEIRGSGYKAGAGGSGPPAQLTNCPWCGTEIDPKRHIKVEPFGSGRGRTIMYCGDALGNCVFSERQAAGEGLPILVVDEEIYRLLPSLLIATVDKFAQMPWNGATEMLFGQVTGYCSRHGFRSADMDDSDSHPARNGLPKAETRACHPLRPPDLIIQDELHLISGPLGTLVGLYETAVDRLATWEVEGRTVRPKVVASTATIRQARDQVHNLFMRTVEVFPPQGLDVEDNFFSLQRPVDDAHPGRVYIGICAPGKRLKAILIRVYVAYLAAAQQLFEKYGSDADPWMTLVGYFNSMRELGGMRRLVEDDVRSRLQKTEERGLARRRAPVLDELTSRMSSTDIPTLLDRLEQAFDPTVDGKRSGRATGQKKSPPAIDVLLATNMISVGVDVKRLGLMVVAGQPKSTSEYIQATSRVGRAFPGLVCTVFNWARPRDLSHYERFEHYHATFYQHVEALSITPFAPRAIDRGLSALLVSLVRLSGTTFNGNKDAARIGREHPHVRAALETIVARTAEINAGARDTVEAELEVRLDDWLAAAGAIGPQALGYRPEKDGLTRGLLLRPGLRAWERFTVLNSLRDVEPTVGLMLDEGSLGEALGWATTTYRATDGDQALADAADDPDDDTDEDNL